jgi:hypothetical protein
MDPATSSQKPGFVPRVPRSIRERTNVTIDTSEYTSDYVPPQEIRAPDSKTLEDVITRIYGLYSPTHAIHKIKIKQLVSNWDRSTSRAAKDVSGEVDKYEYEAQIDRLVKKLEFFEDNWEVVIDFDATGAEAFYKIVKSAMGLGTSSMTATSAPLAQASQGINDTSTAQHNLGIPIEEDEVDEPVPIVQSADNDLARSKNQRELQSGIDSIIRERVEDGHDMKKIDAAALAQAWEIEEWENKTGRSESYEDRIQEAINDLDEWYLIWFSEESDENGRELFQQCFYGRFRSDQAYVKAAVDDGPDGVSEASQDAFDDDIYDLARPASDEDEDGPDDLSQDESSRDSSIQIDYDHEDDSLFGDAGERDNLSLDDSERGSSIHDDHGYDSLFEDDGEASHIEDVDVQSYDADTLAEPTGHDIVADLFTNFLDHEQDGQISPTLPPLPQQGHQEEFLPGNYEVSEQAAPHGNYDSYSQAPALPAGVVLGELPDVESKEQAVEVPADFAQTGNVLQGVAHQLPSFPTQGPAMDAFPSMPTFISGSDIIAQGPANIGVEDEMEYEESLGNKYADAAMPDVLQPGEELQQDSTPAVSSIKPDDSNGYSDCEMEDEREKEVNVETSDQQLHYGANIEGCDVDAEGESIDGDDFSSAVMPEFSAKANEGSFGHDQAASNTPTVFGAFSSGTPTLFDTSNINFGDPMEVWSKPSSNFVIDFGANTANLSGLKREPDTPQQAPHSLSVLPQVTEEEQRLVVPQVTEEHQPTVPEAPPAGVPTLFNTTSFDFGAPMLEWSNPSSNFVIDFGANTADLSGLKGEPYTPQPVPQSSSSSPQVTEEPQATPLNDRIEPTIDHVGVEIQQDATEGTGTEEPLAEQSETTSAQVQKIMDDYTTVVHDFLARIRATEADIANVQQPGSEDQNKLKTLAYVLTQGLVHLEANPQGHVMQSVEVPSGMAAVPEEQDEVIEDPRDTSGMAIVPEEQDQIKVPAEVPTEPVKIVEATKIEEPKEPTEEVSDPTSGEEVAVSGTGEIPEQSAEPTQPSEPRSTHLAPQSPVKKEPEEVPVELNDEVSQWAARNRRKQRIHNAENEALRLHRLDPSQRPSRLCNIARIATRIARFVNEWEAKIEKNLPEPICTSVEDLIDEYRYMDRTDTLATLKAVQRLHNQWVAIRNLMASYARLVKSFGPAARKAIDRQYLDSLALVPGPHKDMLNEALKKKLEMMERRSWNFLSKAQTLQDLAPSLAQSDLGECLQTTLAECSEVIGAVCKGLSIAVFGTKAEDSEDDEL